MLTTNQEQVIVQEAKKDLSAFKILYKEYFPRIYAYVLHMVGNVEITQDIVSQTFENAIKNIDKYEYKGYSFGAWLYAIARNCTMRKGKTAKEVSLNEEIYLGNEIEDNTNVNNEEIRKAALYTAIQKLAPTDREIVILRYIEGFSITEVAFMLNKSEDSIRSHCKRSMDNLKVILNGMTHFV